MDLIGKFIRVHTKTKDDMFGDCIYEITPETRAVKNALTDEEIIRYKCVLLGGSGTSARPGITVWDELAIIEGNIRDGITKVISEEEAKRMAQIYKDQAQVVGGAGTGVVEWDEKNLM